MNRNEAGGSRKDDLTAVLLCLGIAFRGTEKQVCYRRRRDKGFHVDAGFCRRMLFRGQAVADPGFGQEYRRPRRIGFDFVS